MHGRRWICSQIRPCSGPIKSTPTPRRLPADGSPALHQRKSYGPSPLPGQQVAVVLLNRGGTAIGERVSDTPLPPDCHKGKTCTGCFIPGDQPWLAPCDDNATASSGKQLLTFDVGQLPREWLLEATPELPETSVSSLLGLRCEFFDIFATPKKGAALGRMSSFSASVAPHGVRSLLVSNRSSAR